jgi:hypothetical protein
VPHNTPEKRAAYLLKTKEKRAARQDAYNAAHREQQNAWRQANIEKVRAQERARYHADPEKSRAADRAWRRANPEKTREQRRKAGPNKAALRPLYGVWSCLKERCYNTKAPDYPRYGGRGITVCDRWRNSFQAFQDDMLPTFQKGMTIERIDNNGPYSPANCRWATRAEQNRNQRNSIIVDTPWGRMNLADAALRSGLSYAALWCRHRRGQLHFAPSMKHRKTVDGSLFGNV